MAKKKKNALFLDGGGHPMLVFLILVFGVIVTGAVYLYRMQNSPSFFQNTRMNGIDISGMLLDQAQLVQTRMARGVNVIVMENGQEAMAGSLEDFGYVLDKETLDANVQIAMAQQRKDMKTVLNNLFHETNIRLQIPYTFDEDVFRKKVSVENLSAKRVASSDAYLKYMDEEQMYEIIPEVYGNTISDAVLQQVVKEGIEAGLHGEIPGVDCVVSIPDSVYPKPAVFEDDADLVLTRDAYNRYCRTKIVYTFGDEQEVLGWKKIRSWLVITPQDVHFDEGAIREYLADFGRKYDTRYHDRIFTTTGGATITIPAGSNEYGYTVDEDAELVQLLADLPANETITREPVYIRTNVYGNPYYYTRNGVDDLCGTYVECSLSQQHLWFYVRYGLVVESDFVSGDVAKNHQTRTGCFPLAYKESPSILVGDNANEEDNYRTEVSYWMPFIEGMGLHDAVWRGSFGGDIYLTNGSHGCINLPYYAAEAIYNRIASGMAIIVY